MICRKSTLPQRITLDGIHCEREPPQESTMYQKILVPVDGSPTSTRGLEEAIALGRLTGARLRLIHVIDELSFALSVGDGAAYTADLLNLLREGGAAILREAEARVRAAGLAVDSRFDDTFQGRVCDLVVAEAKRWGAELIVLGTHGRRGVGRVFMGSDAEGIVRSATVPVLLVRSSATAPAATQ
jgi:nucleotide-binding universal stress UspA family protein